MKYTDQAIRRSDDTTLESGGSPSSVPIANDGPNTQSPGLPVASRHEGELEANKLESSPRPELSGRVVGGRFEIRAPLASDSLGLLYAAFDRKNQSSLSLRVLSSASFVSRLGSSLSQVMSLSHPGLLQAIGVLRQSGPSTAPSEQHTVMIVQAALEGRSVASQMSVHRQEGRPIELERACQIVLDAVGVLRTVHTAGPHGAVGPETVWTDLQGGVKVTDLALCRAMLASEDTNEEELSSRANLLLAPEVKRGRVPEVASDIYGLSMLLYGLLTGGLPEDAFVPPSRSRPEVTQVLDDLLARGLASNPGDRHPSLEVFETALREASKARKRKPASTQDKGSAQSKPSAAPATRQAQEPVDGSQVLPVLSSPREAPRPEGTGHPQKDGSSKQAPRAERPKPAATARKTADARPASAVNKGAPKVEKPAASTTEKREAARLPDARSAKPERTGPKLRPTLNEFSVATLVATADVPPLGRVLAMPKSAVALARPQSASTPAVAQLAEVSPAASIPRTKSERVARRREAAPESGGARSSKLPPAATSALERPAKSEEREVAASVTPEGLPTRGTAASALSENSKPVAARPSSPPKQEKASAPKQEKALAGAAPLALAKNTSTPIAVEHAALDAKAKLAQSPTEPAKRTQEVDAPKYAIERRDEKSLATQHGIGNAATPTRERATFSHGAASPVRAEPSAVLPDSSVVHAEPSIGSDSSAIGGEPSAVQAEPSLVHADESTAALMPTANLQASAPVQLEVSLAIEANEEDVQEVSRFEHARELLGGVVAWGARQNKHAFLLGGLGVLLIGSLLVLVRADAAVPPGLALLRAKAELSKVQQTFHRQASEDAYKAQADDAARVTFVLETNLRNTRTKATTLSQTVFVPPLSKVRLETLSDLKAYGKPDATVTAYALDDQALAASLAWRLSRIKRPADPELHAVKLFWGDVTSKEVEEERQVAELYELSAQAGRAAKDARRALQRVATRRAFAKVSPGTSLNVRTKAPSANAKARAPYQPRPAATGAARKLHANTKLSAESVARYEEAARRAEARREITASNEISSAAAARVTVSYGPEQVTFDVPVPVRMVRVPVRPLSDASFSDTWATGLEVVKDQTPAAAIATIERHIPWQVRPVKLLGLELRALTWLYAIPCVLLTLMGLVSWRMLSIETRRALWARVKRARVEPAAQTQTT